MIRLRRACVFLLLASAADMACAQSIELPVRSDPEGQVVLVAATINGRSATLIFDTGASRTIVAHQFVGLKKRDVHAARFAGGQPGLTGEGHWVEVTLMTGPAERKASVFVMNLDEVSRRVGERVDGLLGLDFLRQFRSVTLDWQTHKLRLEPK